MAPDEPRDTFSCSVPHAGKQQGLAGTLDGVDDVKTEEPGSLAVAPRPPQDNWLELIEGAAVGGFAGGFGSDVYSDVKTACRAAVQKFRDRRPDPDEESLWMHQLIVEASMGPCPPGHKLVHLNGYGLDNRRANLAYVPESDPRPAVPLNPRPPGWAVNTAAMEPRQRAAGRTRPANKKRRKGKRKHR